MKTNKTRIDKWKTIALIFIILFALETSLFVWSYYTVIKEERMTMECYYDICEDYPDAYLEENLCLCWDYDVWGEPIIVKQKYMG